MKGFWKAALAILVITACGRDGAITEPVQPVPSPIVPGPGVLALGVDSTTGASIETNKDDYVPGEVVHVVGRGWAAGETVNLHMTEDPDTHADVDTNVVADATGGFSIHFYDVQPHDLGVTFTLTATGQASHGSAVAVFTDGNFAMQSAFIPVGGPTFDGTMVKFAQSSSCDPSSSGQTTLTAPVTTSSGPSQGVNNNTTPVQSATLSVPASVPGYAFSHWSISGSVTLVSGTVNTPTICVLGTAPGSGGARVFTANYVASNAVPDVSAGDDATINEGSTFSQNGSFTDPDANSWTATVDYGDGSGTQPLSLVGKTFALSHVYTDNGTYNVTVTVNDGTASGSDVVVVTVNNVAPTATFNAPSPVDEGSNISLSLTNPVDPSSDDVAAGFTYEFDCGLGAGYESSVTNTRSCPTTDNGSRTVKGKILDKDGGFTAYSATVTINNVAPTLNSVTGPATPVPVNTSTGITLNFSDPAGSYDTYTAEVNWDDGLGYVSVGSVTSGGSVIKTFTSAGVYTVCAKVSDEDGGTSNESCFAYIVVYDPSGGFVTGGGWIMSPAGAFIADPGLTGKANFGFVSKYERNKTLPQGNTEFQFHAGNLNFKSTVYEWLVVSGPLAQYKGEGTINGTGNYGFLLTGKDGHAAGGGGIDKFRIKIWNKTTNAVVYDNGLDAPEDSDVSTALGGGSIVIHNKK